MHIKPEIKQAIYTFGVHLNMFSLGTATAFPGTLIPELLDPSSSIKIDLRMVSWIVSMPGLSGLFPMLLLGPLMHYTGRKVANLSLTVPILMGWILTYLAGEYTSISMLLAGRFLHGLPLGAPFFISVCIAEFSSPKMRSTLLGFKPITATLGCAILQMMSYFLNWKNLALIGAMPPALAILVTVFWPETPEWLVSRERYEEAAAVFYSLRGYSKEGERELKQIVDCEKARRRFAVENKRSFDILRKLKSRVLWKPVAVLFFTVLVPSMGGRHFIPSYSIHLAVQLSGDKAKGYLYAMVGNVIAILAAFLNLYLLRRFSRRNLLFSTGFLGFVMLAVSCAMLYIRTIYPSEVLSYSILGVFAVYYFLGNCGFYPVSYVLMGEILPLEYRAIGSFVDGMLLSLGTAVVVGAMPWLEKGMGTHGMLLFFGCFMLLSLVYLYYNLPETKNRTLHDVGDYFRGKSPKIRRGNDTTFNEEESRSMFERP